MPWTLFETNLGVCGLAWNDAGVTWVQLPEATRDATRDRLVTRAHDAGREARSAVPPWVKDAIARLREHLGGKPQDLTRVPLDLARATPFHVKVYRALQGVPAGTTVSYGDLASTIGAPGAARAVGRAMAKNPFPLLVPCHRVLAAGGRAGGFSAYGGRVTKERILAVEGATLAPGAPRAPVRARALPSRARVRARGGVSGAQASLFDGRHALPFDWDAAVAHVSAGDAVLAKHIARVGGERRLRLEGTEGTFAALCQSIVYQQLSGKAAATILGRVRALFPGGALEPERLLATGDAALRGAGLSGGKLASLRDLAERTTRGEIPSLAELETMEDEAIVERLVAVRGIGRWTVEMLLIFRLGRPDVLPVADFGVRKGFARLFARGAKKDALPEPEEVARRGERWRPFRSVASWYLWRVLDLDGGT